MKQSPSLHARNGFECVLFYFIAAFMVISVVLPDWQLSNAHNSKAESVHRDLDGFDHATRAGSDLSQGRPALRALAWPKTELRKGSSHPGLVIPGPFLMPTCTPPTGIIISEFRLRGPNGVNDEFIELYNNTDVAVTICTADGSSGWAVASSEGTVRFVVPSNTTIPGRAHYLAVGSSYSLTGYAASDLAYASDIPDNQGIALFNTANPANFTTGNRLDAVGFTSTNSLYREGTGLTAIGAGNVEYTFRRNLGAGTPADTNNNSVDFQYLATDGTFGSKLGAPGPENLGSPIQRNAHMPVVLLDATVAGSVTPNRVRDLTSDPANNSTFGTLSIRRRIVNNTGVHVSRLRFRVTTLTTYPVPSGTADLRVRTSTAFVTMNINDANTCAATGTPATPPCTVTVQGTTLEQPPNQPNGGGYNSTLSVALPQPLAPGASVNFQMLVGLQQTGSFQFFINVEASTDSASPRLDPMNQTGGEGEDPLSRNYNWNVGLVGLPGRAGLDLGLSLAHNSLVWTKSGSFMSFDDDRGFPSPGFRLGFPVIQPLHYNAQAAKNAFMLITPNGKRVELRQVGTSPLYEAADSSHLLLDTTSTMTLSTTDGTQLLYDWQGSDFQCTEIKDRNGNFITINYNEFGRIDTIVDTLNRTIRFNYDGSESLISITQDWTVNGAPQQHTWASFVYRNPDLPIQVNFPGLINVGPQTGSTLKVLSEVTLNDGSRFNFDYTSWGQVWKISNFAADGHLLNYRSYNLPLDGNTAQSDCPRFTERRDWARNWNGDTNGVPASNEESVTGFAAPTATSWTMPDGTPQTGTLAQVTLPDGTYQKIFSHASGWDKGLPLLSETYDSGQVRQRQSATKWIQDNTGLTYPDNPRVEEANVYDPAGNRARTRITYQNVSLPDGTSCKLPQDLFEYQANATAVLRRTHTDYNLATAYSSRRIIGLVSEKKLYEVDPNTQAETLMSKVGLEYDETGSIQGTDAPVQHDNTNYGASFLVGRANLSSVKRYDVLNTALFVTSIMKYNTAGAVVRTTDPAGHQVQLSYTDQFSANGTTLDPALSFATMAYPTTITDADGYTSNSRYNYDFGAVTWKQTPLPNTTVNTPGPQQKLTYDDKGRIERITSLVNNAYTRFIYGPNYVESFGSVNNVADEAHALQVFDGAGRVIAKAGNHPGSTGGFSGQLIHYDVMGRVKKQSNPTETTISISSVLQPYDWQAIGDDAQAGWIYTQQTYDWKGRPLVTTNPSTTSNPAETTTKEANYSGCGCAGGQVVTLTDEGTIVWIEGNQIAKKRQRKVYSDILGRVIKTEVLNWDGTGPFGTGDTATVYSAAVNTYNARDQVTRVRQFEGPAPVDPNYLSCPSGTCQETTITYDGHGRLKSRHVPGQDSGTARILAYNSDDTLQEVTDARGSVSSMSYNARHLITEKTYQPGAGITDTPDVSFDYDAAGNRISMTDGLGSKSYVYDLLSRLSSETRMFTIGSFPLTYDYNLAGQLKKITYPGNMTINYVYDTARRPSAVTGSDNLYFGVSQYASGFAYRAWGGLKQMTDGTNHTSSFGFNSRMQVNHFEISGGVVSQNYDYFNDGRIKFVDNLNDHNFDRSYFYDHDTRLTIANSGGAANVQVVDVPYQETFAYDAFGHTSHRFTEIWTQDDFLDFASYLGDRRNGWGYDADGRIKTIETRQYHYDAAGQQELMTGQVWGGASYYSTSMASDFDGDGNRVKEVSTDPFFTKATHYLRSSVLGGAIVQEINSAGQTIGYVYTPGGQLLTKQMGLPAWKHATPVGSTQFDVGQDGFVRREFDPVGADVPLEAPPPHSHGDGDGDLRGGVGGSPADARFSNLANPAAGCIVGWLEMPCNWVTRGSLSWLDVSYQAAQKQPPGSNFFGRWVADEGRRLDKHGTLVGAEFDEADTIVTNTENDGLGHWEFFAMASGAHPQNTSPDKYVSDKYKKKFNAALTEAEKRLSKEECAKLFGKTAADLIAMLQNTEYRILPLTSGGPKYDSATNTTTVTGAQTNSPTSVFINSKGPFLQNVMFVPGAPRNPVTLDFNSRLRGAQFGALLLLHELGHQVKLFGPDASDYKVNLAHTKQVLKECF